MTPAEREARAQHLRDTFGENVRAELRRLDWTFDRLAKEAGIPAATVANTINARSSIAFTGAAFIAMALGKTLDELCGGNSMDPARPELARDDTALACVHKGEWLPERHVCRACLAKWSAWQERLSHTIDTLFTNDQQEPTNADHPTPR